jgi:formate dehydrogenase alpha subunit
MTNPINDISNEAELMLLIGTNTTEAHPVIGYKMRQAARKGCKMIVCDPRRIDLVDDADYWIRHNPGTDIPLLNGMMHIIIKEGLEDKEFVAERTENYEALKATVEAYNPEYVAELTGISVDDLYTVARLYATTDKAMIFYTLGITEHICGTRNVMSIANLAMLTGHVGRPGTGVCPIRGQNNVQGACDMGALPNVFPAYQAVNNDEIRSKFEQAWGVSLPANIGLKIPEMFEAAHAGKVKAMYILGENPVLTDPNANHIKEALENLDFLVVQELFLTETAEFADVILPAASFSECDGTFTSTERRVQRVRKAIEPLPDLGYYAAAPLGHTMDFGYFYIIAHLYRHIGQNPAGKQGALSAHANYKNISYLFTHCYTSNTLIASNLHTCGQRPQPTQLFRFITATFSSSRKLTPVQPNLMHTLQPVQSSGST